MIWKRAVLLVALTFIANDATMVMGRVRGGGSTVIVGEPRARDGGPRSGVKARRQYPPGLAAASTEVWISDDLTVYINNTGPTSNGQPEAVFDIGSDLSYGGTGCPAGTSVIAIVSTASITNTTTSTEMAMTTTTGIDVAAFSVLFNREYVASATNGRERVSCNIALPINVRPGFAFDVSRVEYRGKVRVPAIGEARLSTEYFYAGDQGPTTRETFDGPVNRAFTSFNSSSITSSCGQSTHFRINTALTAMKDGGAGQAARIGLERVDFVATWRRCS